MAHAESPQPTTPCRGHVTVKHHRDCEVTRRGVCTCSGKPLSPLALKALQRPADYFELSARRQWAIDKALVILDWEGD